MWIQEEEREQKMSFQRGELGILWANGEGDGSGWTCVMKGEGATRHEVKEKGVGITSG